MISEMEDLDREPMFPVHKAIFDGDLKLLSSLLKSHNADSKDKFGKLMKSLICMKSQRRPGLINFINRQNKCSGLSGFKFFFFQRIKRH